MYIFDFQKKIIMTRNLSLIILLVLQVNAGFGQDTRIRTDFSEITGRRYSTEKSKIEGSPYLNKFFYNANIGENFNNVFMRYNVYKDEFEFINQKNDTLVLNKSDDYKNITFTGLKTTYNLISYVEKKETKKGYFLLVHKKNNTILYKKQRISFFAAKSASTPYGNDVPAKFVPTDDKYFIKFNEQEILELTTSKKAIIKLFPEKKTEIENYIKTNNLDLEKEKDLIRLIDFLAN